MGIQIFQYSESHLEGLRSILMEYMTFLANQMNKPPWNFNIEVENGVNFSMKNLDKFAKPDGRLFIVKVDDQIAGTISMRKIRDDSGEIKRMFVRPKFRGKNLGNLMIEEVIEVAKKNSYSRLYLDTAQFMSSAVSLYEKYGFKKLNHIQNALLQKNYGIIGFL